MLEELETKAILEHKKQEEEVNMAKSFLDTVLADGDFNAGDARIWDIVEREIENDLKEITVLQDLSISRTQYHIAHDRVCDGRATRK